MSLVLIEKRVITSTTSSNITFTGPWNDYTDLEIYGNVYCSGTGVQAIKMQLNGDTGSNYSNYWMETMGGSGLNSSGESSTTSMWTVYTPSNNSTVPLSFRARLFDINSTTFTKPIVSRYGGIFAYSGTYNNVWKSNSQITSISLLRNGEPNILAGSSFILYGVK
jgi:hypothetical protein